MTVRPVIAVALPAVCLLAGLGAFPPGRRDVLAPRVESLPTIDGEYEAAWDQARPIRVPLLGGRSAVPYMEVRALHDSRELCVLLQWPDPGESRDRTPWEFDGERWRRLPPWAVYEDKVAIYWAMGDVPEFEDLGCAAVCHYGGGKSGKMRRETGWPGPLNVGAHFTPRDGELLDEWHWKAHRTDPFAQLDDGYLDDARPAPGNEAAGRKADEPKESGGGYVDNKTEDGKAPAFRANGSTADPLQLMGENARPISEHDVFRPGDRVPGLLLFPLRGRRGDVTAKGAWRDGRWTLEVSRALGTGDPHDVVFAQGREHAFGVAIYNSQEFEHSYSPGVWRLRLL